MATCAVNERSLITSWGKTDCTYVHSMCTCPAVTYVREGAQWTPVCRHHLHVWNERTELETKLYEIEE